MDRWTRLLTYTIVIKVLLLRGVSAKVISFDCGGLSSGFCPNTTLNLICKVTYIALTWNLDGYNDIFFTSLDTVGKVVVRGPYRAELLAQQFGNTQSRLTFLVEESFSGQSISCMDGGDNDFKACPLNIAETPSMPSNFTVITHLKEADNWIIELVWLPPVDSHISNYNILTHPPIDNEHCTCGNCTCNCTSIVFEGLNVSQIYSFSLLAVNCIGAGNGTVITISAMWLSSTMTSLPNTNILTDSSATMDLTTFEYQPSLTIILTTSITTSSNIGVSHHSIIPSGGQSNWMIYTVSSSMMTVLVNNNTETGTVDSTMNTVTGNFNIIVIACATSVLMTILCAIISMVICLLHWKCKARRTIPNSEIFHMTENSVYMYMQRIDTKQNSAYDWIHKDANIN